MFSRRTLVAGAALIAALITFAGASLLAVPYADLLRGGASLAGLAVVALHTVAGDEVERALAYKAGFAVFVMMLAAALALRLGFIDAGAVAEHAWALMIGAWLAAWAVFRVRLS